MNTLSKSNVVIRLYTLTLSLDSKHHHGLCTNEIPLSDVANWIA